MERTHSPGPWRLSEAANAAITDTLIWDAKDELVAYASTRHKGRVKAQENARLIVDAWRIPHFKDTIAELLAALEQAAPVVRAVTHFPPCHGLWECTCGLWAIREAVDAAIAKAHKKT